MKSKQMLIPIVDPGTLQMSVQAQPLEQGQTWTSDVLVPLTQNLVGGIAVAGLGFIAFVAHSTWYQVFWQTTNGLLWCGLVGGVVTCLMTIIRFFSDDVGIVVAAYKAGQRSMLPRISALEGDLLATQRVMQDKTDYSSAEARVMEVFARARDDAERLIRLHFEGEKIDRKSMVSRGMGQRDWERARRLLQSAGIVAGEGRFALQTPAEAIQTLNARFIADTKRKGKARTFTPAWQ